jgi:hypothetical protein
MLAQGACNFQEIIEAEVSFAAFNAAYVGCVQASAFGELLLRPAFRKSQLPDFFPESAFVWRQHARRHRGRQTMSPETMSIVILKMGQN